MANVENRLGEFRRRRGLSAIQLAAAVSVSRQTIYAMEAGTYIPNTTVALRLARALDTTVEELFSIPDDLAATALRTEQVSLLPGSGNLQTGHAVQLCRVNKKLMASAPAPVQWYFSPTDAVLARQPNREGGARVRIFQAEGDFTNRILVAGCDPGISVLSRYLHASGIELVLAHRNSSQALALLKEGCVHVAGTHLSEDANGESNLPAIGRLFPGNSVAVISFAVWEEGIVTAPGNPKDINGIEDFARKKVSIVNREKGSGSRALLDSRLKKLGLDGQAVRGYDRLALGHLPAASQVQSGEVDCCLATRAAARALGLGFVPLISERYDLVVRKQHISLPPMQNLFDALTRSGFRRELEGLGGYDAKLAGERQL